MITEVEESIKALTMKVTNTFEVDDRVYNESRSGDALKFTQSALNLAHVLKILEEIETTRALVAGMVRDVTKY